MSIARRRDPLDGRRRPGRPGRQGRGDATELLDAAIERIERFDGALNAVVIRWFDHARDVAADPDLPDGPFRGVPFLLKDLYTSFAGQTLSNGNAALRAAGESTRSTPRSSPASRPPAS